MQVLARVPSALAVDVQLGTAFVDGFFVEVYGNPEPVTIAAGGTGARFDRVVAKLDRQARTLSIAVVQGTPLSGLPALPADTIPLAYVSVPANASSVVQVLDERRWARAAGVHAGDIKATGRTSPPAGWLPCDGRTLTRSDYPDLFAAIGTSYGAGDGQSTFRIPDLRARFPVGVGSGYPLGSTGGEAWVTLDIGHLPTHTHAAGTLAVGSAGSHDHVLSFRTISSAVAHNHASSTVLSAGTTTPDFTVSSASNSIANAGSHTHPLTGNTAARGQQLSHENRPPYQTVHYIIAT
jgi:microcystin-dependent protein